MAGAEIVGAVDMWEIATRTFARNFPTAVIKTSRLENIDPHALKEEVGSIQLLLASPECTNHTCAKGSKPRLEESRATAMQTLRFARAFRPRWIVLENVVHMRPWSRYEELKAELRALGYSVREATLDASHFGVPQRRRRLFLLCDREREPRAPNGIPQEIKSVNMILDEPGTWRTSPLFHPRRATATLQRAERAFESVGRDTPFLIVYYGSDGSGGWQALDRPLRTITTVDRFALVQPTAEGHQMRMLQVPELARAMGVDRTYRLDLGSRRERIQILGNGVCPPVMRDVVRALAT
jgi:DNA (cytosine-5)-methyltransferase 1